MPHPIKVDQTFSTLGVCECDEVWEIKNEMSVITCGERLHTGDTAVDCVTGEYDICPHG